MKITYASTNMTWSGPLLEELRAHHTVKVWPWTRNKDLDLPNLMGLVNWADVVYVEFIQHPLPWLTHQEWIDKPIVTRVGGLDVFGHASINWRKISAFVLMPVQEKRLHRLRGRWRKLNPGKELPKLPTKILRRSIGIDLDLFRPDYKRKPTYEIVFHANVMRPTKRVYTAIQCLYELIDQDEKKPWHLTLIGQWEGGWAWPERKEYVIATQELIEELRIPEQRLTIVPNFLRNEWAQFIRSRDVFWNLSFREAFPASAAEACASGVHLVMNWWYNAQLLYPERYLCRTPTEIVEHTKAWGNLSEALKITERPNLRRHVEKYDIRETCRMIRALLEEVEG